MELAEPLAFAMRPRRRRGSNDSRPPPAKVTAYGIWLKGKVSPPPNGDVIVGQGRVCPHGERKVVRMATPLSFRPRPGARRHAALSMPGWRFVRSAGRMLPSSELPSREGQRQGQEGGRRGQDAPPPPSIAMARAGMVSSLGWARAEEFSVALLRVAQHHGVGIEAVCPFAVFHGSERCRPGLGCLNPRRVGWAGVGCLPCAGPAVAVEGQAGAVADASLEAASEAAADMAAMEAAEHVWGEAPPPAEMAAPLPAGDPETRWETALFAAAKAQGALLRVRAPVGGGDAAAAAAEATVRSDTAQWVDLPQVQRIQRLSAYISSVRAAIAAERDAGEQRGRGSDVRAAEPRGARSRSASADGGSASGTSTHDLD